MAEPVDNRSLGELLSELSRETGTLVRKELELATTEMTAKVKTASRQVAIAAAGGALAHAGLLILLAALVIILSRIGVPLWLSALIVGMLTIGIGYAMVNNALATMRRTNMTPTQTIESIKENAKWTTGQRA
jgi:Putative Actinobacterial Holin-X, holin superfamily III